MHAKSFFQFERPTIIQTHFRIKGQFFPNLLNMYSFKADFGKRIGGAETSDELREIKEEMHALSKRLDKKLGKLEKKELEIGLNYRGRAGFECHCGNRVDQTKRYFNCCRECGRNSCVECSSKCGVCGTTNICSWVENDDDDDEPCLKPCGGCEECFFMCPECRSNAKTCDNCKEPMCDECLNTLAYNDYCPQCYDYLNADGSGRRFSQYR